MLIVLVEAISAGKLARVTAVAVLVLSNRCITVISFVPIGAAVYG
jgi:hypothetical protein